MLRLTAGAAVVEHHGAGEGGAAAGGRRRMACRDQARRGGGIYAGLMQRVVINDLLTQLTAVFVTIGGGGASNGSGTCTKTTGNYRVADPRHGPGDAGGARPPGATRLGL